MATSQNRSIPIHDLQKYKLSFKEESKILNIILKLGNCLVHFELIFLQKEKKAINDLLKLHVTSEKKEIKKLNQELKNRQSLVEEMIEYYNRILNQTTKEKLFSLVTSKRKGGQPALINLLVYELSKLFVEGKNINWPKVISSIEHVGKNYDDLKKFEICFHVFGQIDPNIKINILDSILKERVRSRYNKWKTLCGQERISPDLIKKSTHPKSLKF